MAKTDITKYSENTRFKSGQKAIESGRKGGIKSGESKRRKKELKECLEILLEKEFSDKKGNLVTGAEAISAKLFEKAMKGDIRAFEVVRDTAGQKPIEKVQVAEVDQETIDKVEAMFDDI